MGASGSHNVGVAGAQPPDTKGAASSSACSSSPPGHSFNNGLDECWDVCTSVEREQKATLSRAADAVKALLGNEVKLIRMASVTGRMIFVLDGVVPNAVRDHLFHCLQSDAFTRTEFARPDTQDYRHHIVEYSIAELSKTQLWGVVEKAARALFPVEAGKRPLEVYRIYTNAVFFSDVGFVHRDSNEDTHVTALVYPNPEWTSELGGETVFYTERGDIVASVEPKPGRVVLFRGSIMHKGSPPTRLCYAPRYTTAFKFAPPEEADSS